MKPRIQSFFDARTNTLTYVVWDEESRDAVVIDPVLDYEPVGSYTFTQSVDEVIGFVHAVALAASSGARLVSVHACAEGSPPLELPLAGELLTRWSRPADSVSHERALHACRRPLLWVPSAG